MTKPHVLTEADGAELVQLLNGATEAATHETLLITDMFLHYGAGKGWRVRFGGATNEAETQAWISNAGGPWASLHDTLRAETNVFRSDVAATTITRRPSRRAATTAEAE